METAIKILHLDLEYQAMYLIIRNNSLIKSRIPLEMAKDLIIKDEPQLIICEPLNKALFNQQVSHLVVDRREKPEKRRD